MVGILGETMTSYIHSEFNWPLVWMTFFKTKLVNSWFVTHVWSWKNVVKIHRSTGCVWLRTKLACHNGAKTFLKLHLKWNTCDKGRIESKVNMLKFVHSKIELHDIQLTQFYSHFRYNINCISWLSADVILKMTT